MLKNISILLLKCFCIILINFQTSEALTITKERPRTLINQSDVERIRSQIRTISLIEYKNLCNRVNYEISSNSPDKIYKSQQPSDLIKNLAFISLISRNKNYLQSTISYAASLAEVKCDFGNDSTKSNRLTTLSYVYDWLHDQLPDKQKSKIKKAIIKHIVHLKSFMSSPKFTGGHSRQVNTAILAALVSIYGDTDENELDVERLLEAMQELWEKGYNPVQSYIASDGGYHMGWNYGLTYTSHTPYIIWENATGIEWCKDWLSKQADWFIYGLRGDLTFPRTGDCWNVNFTSYIASRIAIFAGKYKNKYAEWYYTQIYQNKYPSLMRIIYRDPTVVAEPPNALPNAKLFKNAGVVIARNTWDENTCHVVFKSSSFYTLNHHHKDQNHFELSYKGSLLIDSGSYQPLGYDSKHWANYYTRTIAHNSMIAYDPDEDYIYHKRRLKNDGGQRFMENRANSMPVEPKNIEDILSSEFSFDGITGFSQNGECCWMQGNASKAYNPKKVKTYLRDILFIYNTVSGSRPALLILDRIILNKDIVPKIIFHSNKKPTIENNFFQIENSGSGVLYGELLTSSNLNMEVIGGHGHEWYVENENITLPKDWKKYQAKSGLDVGEWRIEISNGIGVSKDFLTLLYIDDKRNLSGRPNAVGVKGEEYYGAVFGKTIIIIITHNFGSILHLRDIVYDDDKRIYLCGSLPKGKFKIKFNKKNAYSTSKNVVLCNLISQNLQLKQLK